MRDFLKARLWGGTGNVVLGIFEDDVHTFVRAVLIRLTGETAQMRATIKNYLEAEKKRREEQGEEGGFSLIELIIVVVILGILVAVAIPIFANIQTTARHNALEAAAANGATAAAAAIANNKSATDVAAAAESAGSGSITVAIAAGGSTSDASAICVRATNDEATPEWAQAGTLAACNSRSWDVAP